MKKYLKTLSNGEAVEVPANDGVALGVETLDSATTLTGADSGKTLVLSAAAGAQVDLPSPVSGMKFKFIVGSAFATTDWTIVADADVIEGSAVVANVSVPAVNENTISFVASAESIGDYVQLESDGTSWFVNGAGATAGSITFTAPA